MMELIDGLALFYPANAFGFVFLLGCQHSKYNMLPRIEEEASEQKAKNLHEKLNLVIVRYPALNQERQPALSY